MTQPTRPKPCLTCGYLRATPRGRRKTHTCGKWYMQQSFAACAHGVAEQEYRWITELGFWDGEQWVKPGTTLRIRVPKKFEVTHA